jgi:hypothetical protein
VIVTEDTTLGELRAMLDARDIEAIQVVRYAVQPEGDDAPSWEYEVTAYAPRIGSNTRHASLAIAISELLATVDRYIASAKEN